jgi:S-adenosylmethionine hydrolase
MTQPPLVLLTDFGTRDTYVGIVKGVLSRLAPESRHIDLTHAIPPGDVRAGAFALWQAIPYLPTGSVVLGVVDPGVGTSRRAIALRLPNGFGVGPDNGLFSWILDPAAPVEAVELDPTRFAPGALSATFHGRDLFAPVAARLAVTPSLADLGHPRAEIVRLPPPCLESVAAGLRGEVLWIDGFGNAVTSLGRLRAAGDSYRFSAAWHDLRPRVLRASTLRLELPSGVRLPLARTFGDVPAGEPLAYVGSSGLVEVGVHAGRADQRFNLAPGQAVTLRFEE